MKITSYRAIFEIIYIIHWNNLCISFKLEVNKKEPLINTNNDINYY